MQRLLFIALSLALPNFAVAEGRPNFLVILCDDLGYGDLACFGHPTIKTPHLDRLAQQGMRLTDCYSSAPVCSPSRAGLLTGRTPTRLGIYDWIAPGQPIHLKQEEITIATLLQKAGYATCHVGKWHLNGKFNSAQQPQPGDHGFDHWLSTQNNAGPSHENPTNFVRNGEKVGKLAGFSCQLVADEAIRWLQEQRDAKKPFFQFVCFHEPHEPIASPDDLVKTYPDAVKRGEALYYANVTNMDRAVGRLMAALDEQKLADNTLVFFTSDNGPETVNRYAGAWRSHGSPGPLRGMKLHIYEGGIRVPGILRWPGKIKAGQTSDTPVCGLDVLPTLCELASIDPPANKQLDGASIAPLLSGAAVARKQPLIWHYYRAFSPAKVAIRDGDWKLVGLCDSAALSPGGAVQRGDVAHIKKSKLVDFELYNLRDDRGETKNLAAAQPERAAAMQKQPVERYQQVIDEGPAWGFRRSN
jgi:arylsulfatase A